MDYLQSGTLLIIILTCLNSYPLHIKSMTSINIPEYAGVILLNNAVTFPHGALPLHIFEPRYKKMLEDAFAADSMICVANLQSEETADPAECVAKIGFIGLIRAAEKQEDGRSNLILHAVIRVEFLDRETNSSYPYPRAKIRAFMDLTEPSSEATDLIIQSLRDATSRFTAQFNEEVVSHTNTILDRVGKELGILSDVIAQQFVIDHQVRQSLLEENVPSKRAEVLIRYLRTRKK